MKNTKVKDASKKEVSCISCKQVVFVTLVSYGNGHIAICPCCKQLAYNGA